MVRHPQLEVGKEIVESTAAGPLESLQVGHLAHPHGQVHVLALVPERGSGAAIPPLSGRLPPGRLCHRSKEDDSLDEGEPREGLGHIVGRPAEGLAVSQADPILVLDLRVGRIGIEP